MADYTRLKEGFRFEFAGMKLNSSPDSLQQGKYPLAINIRAYSDSSIRTRPGTTKLFQGGALDQFFTDIRAYTSLLTDDLPRILARTANDSIYLDSQVKVGTLAGGGSTLGAVMIPFRPNASPTPYMYIANGKDYQKFSAPVPGPDTVVQQKVGIAEPQSAPDAGISGISPGGTLPFVPIVLSGGTSGGTAGGIASGNRVSDTAGVVLGLVSGSTTLWGVQVSSAVQYQRLMKILIGVNSFIIQDVIPPLPSPIAITGIYYFVGTTGHCIVALANLGAGPGNTNNSIYQQNLLSTLQRGAIIKIGSEFAQVWSVSQGPDGTVSIETSTTGTHTTADALTSVPCILLCENTPISGSAIAAAQYSYAVTTGIGTQTNAISNPFASSSVATQEDDYISIGIKVDNLLNLNEVKLLLDVGDGSFTKDFYYYTIRPSDIAAAVANSSTQLSVVQTLDQRATIDEENAAASGGQLQSASSAQTAPGSNEWSQIVFPISALTRVGSDSTKSLQTVNKLQFLWNASGTINISVGDFLVFGYSQPDVGDVGAPYQYRVRPRSKVTGAVGNPSPATRYGVSPRRRTVILALPSATYDSQIDTWDIFRYGGSVTSWRYVGSTLSSNSTFQDNYSDDEVSKGDALDFDNYEPWPSVDIPNNGTASIVNGTIAVISTTDQDVQNYLPGTLVQLGGQNVYTLWARPVHLTGTNYLLQFVENAGAGTNVPYNIQEPLIANQKLPFMWGPDVNGTIFAVGDPLNPGKLYFAKGNAPDSAPDTFNIEITPPSEPLLGGEVVDGLSFVGSPERWWALYPQPDNPLQRYNFVQQPIPRGLGAPFGHCTDGVSIFFWAKDGIWSSTKGSLTDDDLFNLFPHEGVAGQNVTYNGVTIPAPDYTLAAEFRLAHANGYLYALYADINGAKHLLVLDLHRMAWSFDIYATQVTAVYKIEQQMESFSQRNAILLMGRYLDNAHTQGMIVEQTDLQNDEASTPISCILATREFDGGDIRAGEQWGDVFLDSLPVAKGAPLVITPMNLGVLIVAPQTVPQATIRTQQPVSLGGQVLSNFLGLFITWTDDFTQQTSPTTLYIWQPSFIPKPETIADRITDWDDAGIDGAKWIQGFILRADTFNVVKGMAVRDSDALALHPFTPTVQHNGESEIAYSFNQPFIAHQVRLEPTDILSWRMFDVRWVAEPTPEFAETWTTQPSTHGLKGFMHLRQASITYSSTTPVTLTVGVFDGTAPAAIVLPSTGGIVKKLVVPFTFNKGQLYTYSFTGASPFQVYQDKCEVLVGAWGREDSYINRPLVGDTGGDEAKI